jgi:hypothetical protein
MSLDSFLNALVTTAIQTLQVSDATLGNDFADDDPIVRVMAKAAYSQICSFCNRYFEKAEFNEEYHSVFDKINLRHSPVETVSGLWIRGVPLILDVDYSVAGNRITLLKAYDYMEYPLWDMEYFPYYYTERMREHSVFTNVCLTRDKDVVVKYTGGYPYADSNNDLFTGLLLQTMTLYNRRSTLGMSSISGTVGHTGPATVAGASDMGDLLEVVKGIMIAFINFRDVDYV